MTNNALSLSDVAGAQFSGLTGRKSKVNRNLAIVSQIPASREIAASNSARMKQEKQEKQAKALSEEQQKIAKSQSKKASAMQGATTLGQAAYMTKGTWMPAVKNALGIGAETAPPGLTPTGTPGIATTPLADGATAFVNTVPAAPAAPAVAAPAVAPVAETATPAMESMMASGVGDPLAAEVTASAIPAAEVATTAAPATASLSGAASAGMAAAPWAAAGYLAAKFGGGLLENVAGKGESNVVSQFARTVQKPLSGIGRPWAEEIFKNDEGTKKAITTAMDVLNPIGFLVAKSGCVIITACTSPDAPEVQIARAYRDAHLSPEQLRGYYMIAEKIVPLMLRYPRIKSFVKHALVDPLIAVGRHELDRCAAPPSFSARQITRSFLTFCGFLGRRRPSFVRSNGEIV